MPARIGAGDLLLLTLGLLLICAGVLKGMQLATEPTPGTNLFTSRWFLIVVTQIELALGFWLVSGICSRHSWSFAFVAFGILAGVSLSKAVAGDSSCNCFGKVDVHPWHTFALNVLAVAALSFLRPGNRVLKPLSRTSFVIVAFIYSATAIPLAVNASMYKPAYLTEAGRIAGNGRSVVFAADSWVGKRFRLTNYIDNGERLIRGNWAVLLYRSGCPKCEDAILRLTASPARRTGAPRIALVQMPPHVASPQWILERRLFHSRLSPEWNWTMQTPMLLSLCDGVIVESTHNNQEMGTAPYVSQ